MNSSITTHFNEMLVLKLLSEESLSFSEIKRLIHTKSDKIIEFTLNELGVYLYRLRRDKLITESLVGSKEVIYTITDKGKRELIQYIDMFGWYVSAANKILEK